MARPMAWGNAPRLALGWLAAGVSLLVWMGRATASFENGCAGDCNGDRDVTVDELVRAVRIALEQEELATCVAADRDQNGLVTVDEVIAGVTAALNGCPAPSPQESPIVVGASPTPSPSEQASPTATRTLEPTKAAKATPTVRPRPSQTPTPLPTGTSAPLPTHTVARWHFREVTEEAGLRFLHNQIPPIPSFHEWIYYAGGAAAGDFDGDGRIDLAATRYSPPAVLLFRNRGDGTFEEVSAQAGIEVQGLHPNGVAWGDIDNDGDVDLYVTTLGLESRRFLLFVNDGTGHFTEEGRERGAAVESEFSHLGFSASFGDYDRDGYLDVHVTEWKPIVFNRERAPSHTRLLRNRGAQQPGYFEDVTQQAGVDMDAIHPDCVEYGCGVAFASRFVDLDEDGWADLAVASDFGTSRLFWNNRDGTFTDGTMAAGVGTDENGMGSAIGDFDGDGLLDWFVTAIWENGDACESRRRCNWGRSGNRLYRNLGGRRFADVTDLWGVRDAGWGWAATFADFNNDGALDLIATNGQRLPYLDLVGLGQLDDEFETDPLKLWVRQGDHFVDEAPALGIADRRNGRGLLVFDYDEDGDLDVWIMNNSDEPALYRNEGGNERPWLRVQLRGGRSNSQGANARVRMWPAREATPQVREVQLGNNFLGQDEAVCHFGLDSQEESVARLEVRWPASGTVQVLENLPVRHSVVVAEP